MLLYPLLTGWAARDLEQKFKGARLESVYTSETRKTVWLKLFDVKEATGRKKAHLFFSFRPGRQLFFLAPLAEEKTPPGWRIFGPDRGGAFIKSVRQKGGDSALDITFTAGKAAFGNDFFLRFILFGKENRMELFQLPDTEKPDEAWPKEISESSFKTVGEFDLTLSGTEKYLNQHSEISLEESLRKAVRIPAFLARELLHRMQIEPDTNWAALPVEKKEPLRNVIRTLFEPSGFKPTLIFEKKQLKGISLFELDGFENSSQRSFSSFLEAFSYAAACLELNSFEKTLLSEKKGLIERKEKIEQELITFANPEKLRQMGDLILTSKDKIAARAAELVTENWYENTPLEIRIPLDPSKTAKQNAQVYFAKFKKAFRALELLPKRIEATDEELKSVIGLLNRIEAESAVEEKWQLVQELETLYPHPAVAKKIKAKEKPQIGWTFWTKDGFQFRVGRNSEENERLTLHEARKNDLFLHASQSPGSHVILVAEKRPFSKESILEAAAAAAYFSKARHSTKVNVDYTEVRYVQKPRKAKPGLVVLMRSKSVMVYPKKPERKAEPEE